MNENHIALQNSFDKESISQLHAAVLQVSQACYDIKKLCATIIGTVVASGLGFAQVQPDVKISYPFLLIGAMITLLFWVLDVQQYLLQKSLRSRMKDLADGIAQRSGSKLLVGSIGMPVTSESKKLTRLKQAAFNNSMVFYHLLTLMFMIPALLQILGLLPTIILKKSV
jgi:hypothetical protein